MYLLAELESRLSTIDSWPSYILRFLFVDQSNYVTVGRVAAFFFGNGIEWNLAAEFYGLCSQAAGLAEAEQIYLLYQHWQHGPQTFRGVEYFNMLTRRHLYLDGVKVVFDPTPSLLVL